VPSIKKNESLYIFFLRTNGKNHCIKKKNTQQAKPQRLDNEEIRAKTNNPFTFRRKYNL
jgi:hypothetical protein